MPKLPTRKRAGTVPALPSPLCSTKAPTDTILFGVLEHALVEFFIREVDALLENVSERNSCGRLAIYLERYAEHAGLVGYYADTEYNRKQNGEIKTILDDQMKVVVINCDLILHSRGKLAQADNLIAIEMKKSSGSKESMDADRNRLRALTKQTFGDIHSNDGITQPEHVCGYKIGLFLIIKAKDREATLEYFDNGNCTKTILRPF